MRDGTKDTKRPKLLVVDRNLISRLEANERQRRRMQKLEQKRKAKKDGGRKDTKPTG
jgi:hypothetical protein